MDIAQFRKSPLLGILRGVKAEELEPLVETVLASGLGTIEITMNTEGAPQLIRKTAALAGGRLMLGAGTVLTVDELKAALDAGATFAVSPCPVRGVMEHCVKHRVPVFPGALTPAEVYGAWEMGATMVKVFPAKFFGPEYFRELRGPFRDIQLLACAGVTPGNLRDYLHCGANAVSFGASVFREGWLRQKDFGSIGRQIKAFLRAYAVSPSVPPAVAP